MARHSVLSSIVALVVTSHLAAAQTMPPIKPQISANVPPLATMSFTPYAAFGYLGSATIYLGLDGVGFVGSPQPSGEIIFSPYNKSSAYLNSGVMLPNGSYSVQFAFSRVAQPAVFTITRGSSTVLASCSLPPSTTIQVCDSGVFSVSDGQLGVRLAMTQGAQATLAKLTVNHLR
jgi:hypothetical protein